MDCLYGSPFLYGFHTRPYRCWLHRFALAGHIVDLGCGRGKLVDCFPDGARITGVDLRHSELSRYEFQDADHCRRRQDLACGDVYRLPFRSDSVACFSSYCFLEHIADLDAALAEIVRCLTPGGQFLFGVPTDGAGTILARRWTTDRAILRKVDRATLRRMRAVEHVSPAPLVLEKARAHFNVTSTWYYPFILPSVHLNYSIMVRAVKGPKKGGPR
jgi:SAM-dependent methyltransferase